MGEVVDCTISVFYEPGTEREDFGEKCQESIRVARISKIMKTAGCAIGECAWFEGVSE